MAIPPWNGDPDLEPIAAAEIEVPPFSGSPITVTAPALACEAGDLLITVFSHNSGATTTPLDPGWTLIADEPLPGPSLGDALRVFAKVADGTEGDQDWELTPVGATTAGGHWYVLPVRPSLSYFSGYLDTAPVVDDGTAPAIAHVGSPSLRLTIGGVGHNGGEEADGASSDTRDRLIWESTGSSFSDACISVARIDDDDPSAATTYTKQFSGDPWNTTITLLLAYDVLDIFVWDGSVWQRIDAAFSRDGSGWAGVHKVTTWDGSSWL